MTDYLVNSSVAFPPANYFNASNRGVPDISIYGAGIAVLVNRAMTVQGGTSLAAPLLAVIVAMMNEVSLLYTNTTLGNINSLLYQMYAEYPQAFNDITVGSNAGTQQHAAAGCQGYVAAAGWDAVTGLGSPRFAYINAYLVHYFTHNPIIDPTTPSPASFSLSSVAIIGIAVAGGVAGAAIIGFLLVLIACCIKRNKEAAINEQERLANERAMAVRQAGARNPWACQACTLINSSDRVRCFTCGTPMGEHKLRAGSARPLQPVMPA